MKRSICCFSFFLCFITLYFSNSSSASPQSLDDLYKSGKVNLIRDAVFSEEDFGSGIYFQNPRGIAVHSNGWIYVSDFSAHNIKKIGQDGKLIKVIGQEGQGPGDLYSPSFLAIAADKLVVWESMNRRFCSAAITACSR